MYNGRAVLIDKNEFEARGCYVARGLLHGGDFAEVLDDCGRALDGVCEDLRAEGKLQNDYAGLPFAERFLRVTKESGAVLAQNFTIALPQKGWRADTPIFLAPSVFGLLTHARILDAVEELIGAEISVSPVGNVRVKPPEGIIPENDNGDKARRRGLIHATPWHQDNGVVTEEADDTPMITVWFPISDAPVEAGCLQVIPGSHRADVMQHCPDKNGELSIPGRMLPEQKPIPLPMNSGDVLFLHRRLCHASLPNTSAHVRFSFDLRYIPTGAKTGRDVFPSFVARSRANPEAVLTDAREWAQMWLDARARVVKDAPPPGSFNRWRADAAACA